jgi:heme-degrading monooxygenase HmoA
MYARVIQFDILPGKLDDFVDAVESMRPGLRKQPGFRAMFVLRVSAAPPAQYANPGTGEDVISTDEPQVMTFTIWDSYDHMRASEKNFFLYQALARFIEHAKGFPVIKELEVLSSELGDLLADPLRSSGHRAE